MQLRQMLCATATIVATVVSSGAYGQSAKSERKLLDPANIDNTVQPGDNFFMYANGAWLKTNPVPKSETRW